MREPSGAALFGGHGAHVCPSDEGEFWRLFDAAFGALVRSDGRWANGRSLQRYFRRPCWHIPVPPHSLHFLFCRPCSHFGLLPMPRTTRGRDEPTKSTDKPINQSRSNTHVAASRLVARVPASTCGVVKVHAVTTIDSINALSETRLRTSSHLCARAHSSRASDRNILEERARTRRLRRACPAIDPSARRPFVDFASIDSRIRI